MQGGFAGGMDGHRSPARVMPKMLAYSRRTEVRLSAKSLESFTHYPYGESVTAVLKLIINYYNY